VYDAYNMITDVDSGMGSSSRTVMGSVGLITLPSEAPQPQYTQPQVTTNPFSVHLLFFCWLSRPVVS
jgi:hypothetical protein